MKELLRGEAAQLAKEIRLRAPEAESREQKTKQS